MKQIEYIEIQPGYDRDQFSYIHTENILRMLNRWHVINYELKQDGILRRNVRFINGVKYL